MEFETLVVIHFISAVVCFIIQIILKCVLSLDFLGSNHNGAKKSYTAQNIEN